MLQLILYTHHFSSLPSVLMSGILAIFLFKKATDILSNAYGSISIILIKIMFYYNNILCT